MRNLPPVTDRTQFEQLWRKFNERISAMTIDEQRQFLERVIYSLNRQAIGGGR